MSEYKYPHDEAIRAWLDGEQIQYRRGDDHRWVNLPILSSDGPLPMFNRDFSYRIKPKEKIVTMYVYELDRGWTKVHYSGMKYGKIDRAIVEKEMADKNLRLLALTHLTLPPED